MATPVGDSFAVSSGGVIAAGRFIGSANPNLAVWSWPPLSAVSIPAVGGVNAPIHPKVIDTVSGWNGYRYWMAFTPYPTDAGNDIHENPCVVASNDGNTWVAPAANPIEGPPVGYVTGDHFYSDTHLVMDGATLRLFWRETDRTVTPPIENLWMRTSTDGVTWTARELCLTISGRAGRGFLSPSLLKLGDGSWRIWYARADTSNVQIETRTASTPTGPWSSHTPCVWTFPDATREPWHLDVVAIRNGFAMLIADRVKGVYIHGKLWLAYSTDAINFDIAATPAADGSPNAYRSAFVRRSGGFDVWVTDWTARSIRRTTINDARV